MFILSQAQTSFWFLGAGMLIGLGYGTLIPSFQTIAISAAPNHRRGSATATYFSFFDSGIGFGSFRYCRAKSSYHNMYFIAPIIVAFTLLLYYKNLPTLTYTNIHICNYRAWVYFKQNKTTPSKHNVTKENWLNDLTYVGRTHT